DPHTGKLVRELPGHSGAVHTLAFAPNGRTLACGCESKRKAVPHEIYLWDPQKGTLQQRWTGHEAGIATVAFSSNGKLLASASFDGSLRLWETRTGKLRRELRPTTMLPDGYWHSGLWSVAFAPDGRTLAGAGDEGVVIFWEVATGTPRRTLTGHKDCI